MNKFKSGDKVEVKNSSEPAINGFVGEVLASAGFNEHGVRNYRVEATRDFTGRAPFVYRVGDWMYVSEDSLCLIETPQDAVHDPDDSGYLDQLRQDLDATIAEAWQEMHDAVLAERDAERVLEKATAVAEAKTALWRSLRLVREGFDLVDRVTKE